MPEVIVIAKFVTRPGKEGPAEALVTSLVEPTHAEDGCVLYAVHRSIDEPVALTFIERWQSKAQLDAHMGQAHVQGFLLLADEYFSSWDVSLLEAVPLGEPGKGSIAGHATAV